jgi:sec-independent protein translocase protein TatA
MIFLALPGPTEMWVVLIIIVVLFGGAKLPALARAMGASINQFKSGLSDEAEKAERLDESTGTSSEGEGD